MYNQDSKALLIAFYILGSYEQRVKENWSGTFFILDPSENL